MVSKLSESITADVIFRGKQMEISKTRGINTLRRISYKNPKYIKTID